MQADSKESTSPFLCRDFIKVLCAKSKVKAGPITEEVRDGLDLPLIDVCTLEKLSILYRIVKLCQQPVLIAKTTAKKQWRILADFRFTVQHKTDELPWCEYDREKLTVYIFLDGTSKALVKRKKKKKLPKFKCSECLKPDFFVESPPQTLQDLKARLAEMNLLETTNVLYLSMTRPNFTLSWFIGCQNSTVAPVTLEAFARPDLSVAYRQKKKEKETTRQTRDPYEAIYKERDVPPDPNAKNRKTSVQVNFTALNLALLLGLCNLQEMVQIAKALSKYVGALWITFDDDKKARHIVYKDCLAKKGWRLELKGRNDVDDWSSIVERIFKSAEGMKPKKEAVLSTLLYRCQHYLRDRKQRSKWRTCAEQLRMAITRHRIFVFSNDDTALHALKVPLAGEVTQMAHRGNADKAIRMHTLPDNTISALSCKGLLVTNLADAFDYKCQNFDPDNDDQVLWELAREWISTGDGEALASVGPSPMLESQKPNFKSHKFPTMTLRKLKAYLYDRAMRNTDVMLRLWTALVEFNAVNFGYDISSTARTSSSKQAFDIVWLDYARKLGPMGHPIEKMHPHAEFTVRPFCTGGFSYSCKDALEQGKPFQKRESGEERIQDVEEVAQSICEYDLTSSYGFSGKSMAAAKGFGYIFPNGQKRHCSFEYMAVMYTLYKWTVLENLQVLSVFSNFSPLGVMRIGAYPIDLAVVLQDGTLKLFQADGHFIHGDYNHPNCPSLKRYVNDASREQVETKTKLRDKTILEWMEMTSVLGTTYTIVTDCCHQEYRLDALKQAFKTVPELQAHIEGLETLDGTLDCIDRQKVTFLAVVTGACDNVTGQLQWGPIFARDFEAPSPTIHGGSRLMLTSDYYFYLKEQFGFVATDVEWIVYYKRCHDLPKVFDKLLQMRQEQTDKSKAGIIKGIINKACGYFGLNLSNSTRTFTRVATKAPRNYNIYKHSVMPIDLTYKGVAYYVIKTFYKPPKNPFACPTPLPLFVSIVEYGKLRLNQAIQCMQSVVRPTAFRILYCNVDNLIVVFSSDNQIQCFKPEAILNTPSTDALWNSLFAPEGQTEPGKLKLEWSFSSASDWKFASPFQMFYSLITSDVHNDKQKTASYKGLGTLQSYNHALDILKKNPTVIEQERRVEKLVGMDTKTVNITLKSQ